jgi:hypothetical protein
MVYQMSLAEIEYLLAAIYMAEESTERQVDVKALREEIEPYLANSPEPEREFLHALESRQFITTKGADKPRKAGFFWITERGFQAAIEARKRGYTWPPKIFKRQAHRPDLLVTADHASTSFPELRFLGKRTSVTAFL